MSELRLDWTDREHTFQMRVGDVVRVSLWGNATSGFYWSHVSTPDDLLEEIDADHGSASDEAEPPGVLGSGAMREMAFLARRPGTQDLVIRYWRGAEAPEDIQYRVTINVLDGSSTSTDT